MGARGLVWPSTASPARDPENWIPRQAPSRNHRFMSRFSHSALILAEAPKAPRFGFGAGVCVAVMTRPLEPAPCRACGVLLEHPGIQVSQSLARRVRLMAMRKRFGPDIPTALASLHRHLAAGPEIRVPPRLAGGVPAPPPELSRAMRHGAGSSPDLEGGGGARLRSGRHWVRPSPLAVRCGIGDLPWQPTLCHMGGPRASYDPPVALQSHSKHNSHASRDRRTRR